MLDETIAEIRYWHRTRCYSMEQRKRADLSLGSFLRIQLGWSLELPTGDRARIAKQAQALIKLGEHETKALAKGESFEIDEPDYHEWRGIIFASIAARAPFSTLEGNAHKNMERLAQTLPVWPWCAPVKGFGAGSLGVIVGEAGDLSDYPKKGHLWKRMGLAVIDGLRQGGLPKTASADAWIEHGYNRQRRSRMWNIGDALIKSNGDGEYRTYYLARKDYERQRAEAAGLKVAPSAKIPWQERGEYMSDGHIHRRAQRAMEKRLLRDLWQAWRRDDDKLPKGAIRPVPDAEDMAA